jgi:ribosomal protein S18 acetylase RimI-like enzyme
MTGQGEESAWTRDSFLERCLGYPVIRLKVSEAWRQAVAAMRSHPDWLVESRVPVEHVSDLGLLTVSGFRVIDTNVQLQRPAMDRRPGAAVCRFARPEDEPSVRDIARTAFSQTRFHCDPRIPSAAANRVKEEWAANFFSGKRGDWMIVAEDAGRVAGFLQALKTSSPPGAVVIDLIAVAAGSRGRGLARAMIEYAAVACLDRPVPLIVGTQLANVTSLALYVSLGFRIAKAAHVLHLHREDLQL